MPTTSRSPLEYMRRHGLVEQGRTPAPRLDTSGLTLHRIPLGREQLDPQRMLDAAGAPSPDRGRTDEWPPDQEVGLHDSEAQS